MSYRSNAAEAWYPDPQSQSTAAQPEIPLDLLPPSSLTQPLWRSLVGNLRDTFAPEKLPPLELTSRPVNVGLLLGDRLSLSWFRTVFTNIAAVIYPAPASCGASCAGRASGSGSGWGWRPRTFSSWSRWRWGKSD